jgi:hypothetical protein
MPTIRMMIPCFCVSAFDNCAHQWNANLAPSCNNCFTGEDQLFILVKLSILNTVFISKFLTQGLTKRKLEILFILQCAVVG